MHRLITTAALLIGATALAQAPTNRFVPVTDAMLADPDPADWLMWRRTFDHWGYSPLDQIGGRNVTELRLVCTRGLGPGDQEGTPLVHDGIMYFPHPNQSPGSTRACGPTNHARC